MQLIQNTSGSKDLGKPSSDLQDKHALGARQTRFASFQHTLTCRNLGHRPPFPGGCSVKVGKNKT